MSHPPIEHNHEWVFPIRHTHMINPFKIETSWQGTILPRIGRSTPMVARPEEWTSSSTWISSTSLHVGRYPRVVIHSGSRVMVILWLVFLHPTKDGQWTPNSDICPAWDWYFHFFDGLIGLLLSMKIFPMLPFVFPFGYGKISWGALKKNWCLPPAQDSTDPGLLKPPTLRHVLRKYMSQGDSGSPQQQHLGDVWRCYS